VFVSTVNVSGAAVKANTHKNSMLHSLDQIAYKN